MFVLKVELEASIPEISSSDSALHVSDSWLWEQIDQSTNAPTLQLEDTSDKGQLKPLRRRL